MEEWNKQNKSENLYTSASSDFESDAKNPFVKIQLIDYMKFTGSLKQTNEEMRENSQEYKQIVESLERRFRLQLKKEKQFFEIVESKLKQQNEFLITQITSLQHQNKQLSSKLKQAIFSTQIECNSSQDNSKLVQNQVSNLRTMLSNLEKEHENCISNKKELIDERQTLHMKVVILEKESKGLDSICRDLKRKMQSLAQVQIQSKNLKNQAQLLRKQVVSLRVLNQQQEKQFSKQLSSLQKAIEDINSKTSAPDYPQKLISFSSQQTIQNQQQTQSQNYPTFIQSRPRFNTAFDRNSRPSKLTNSNRFGLDSFKKIDLPDSTLSYTNPNQFSETEIIQEIYKKNLSILKQKRPNDQNLSGCNDSEPSKYDHNYNTITQRIIQILPKKSQRSEVCAASSARQNYSSSKNSLANRRYRYL